MNVKNFKFSRIHQGLKKAALTTIIIKVGTQALHRDAEREAKRVCLWVDGQRHGQGHGQWRHFQTAICSEIAHVPVLYIILFRKHYKLETVHFNKLETVQLSDLHL